MSDYEAYLKSPHWMEVRKKRLEKDEYKCAVCGNGGKLDVHHISYKRLGMEDISTDLITLCHPCHAMLHRIREQAKAEYDAYKSAEDCYRDSCECGLKRKICDLLMVEVWMRDVSSGGDLKIWDEGCRMIGSLKKIACMAYPDLEYRPYILDQVYEIKNYLRLAKSMKILELYREDKSLSEVAKKMGMKPNNVQKVLARHGYNATGKIK